MTSIEKRRVGSADIEVDTLGFGCAPLGNLYHAVSDGEAARLLDAAWSWGIRYFDTAPHYGQGLSERRVGDALRPMKGRKYVLSTKVGRLLRPAGHAPERHGFHSPMPFDIVHDYSYDGVMRSFEDSLQRLGLDRIDILLMHDIGAATHGTDNEKLFPIAMDGGYRAMRHLRSEGRVSAIGLGVNEFEVCEAALEHGDWDCFLLAGRYTLLEQESLDTFLPKCTRRNCSIIVGGAYNSGILVTGTRSNAPLRYNYARAPEWVIEKVARIEDTCDRFSVPLPAAALQFPLAHPAVASVIPGIGRASHLEQTLNWFGVEIPAQFWSELIDRGLLRDDAPVPGSC
ncbi:MAG: aldo/keto reductase [Rhodospirillaceae bacterium]|nr:aldo/keto reductase [Rhodospirillaceae bacterium]